MHFIHFFNDDINSINTMFSSIKRLTTKTFSCTEIKEGYRKSLTQINFHNSLRNVCVCLSDTSQETDEHISLWMMCQKLRIAWTDEFHTCEYIYFQHSVRYVFNTEQFNQAKCNVHNKVCTKIIPRDFLTCSNLCYKYDAEEMFVAHIFILGN